MVEVKIQIGRMKKGFKEILRDRMDTQKSTIKTIDKNMVNVG